MNELTSEQFQLIVHAVAPDLRLLTTTPAAAAYTNSVHILHCVSPAGNGMRLAVKRMSDDPDPERATADFHGLRIAREHGIPAPEPLYLDRTGDLLGLPGIVTGFIEGEQVSYPEDVRSWAADIARMLLRVHDARPSAEELTHIYDGIWMGLYFLRDSWPDTMAGHPLTSPIFEAVRELRAGLRRVRPVFLHMDYWPGNILWRRGRISGLVDWDAASYGDPALDVAYFRMNMYLRGIKEAADIFLDYYEAESGSVENLGFWELACAARPLPAPARWLLEYYETRDVGPIVSRAETDLHEFVESALRRAYAGR
jgi:aminoglycoside phosphotransferase (APT) family kinase protein